MKQTGLCNSDFFNKHVQLDSLLAGMADATSRIVVGFLGSILPISTTIMYAAGCLGAGIACLVGGYLQEYTPLVLACVAYGICAGR